MGVCLLLLLILATWLVQTSIISSDNALITAVVLPMVENSFSNQSNNTQAVFLDGTKTINGWNGNKDVIKIKENIKIKYCTFDVEKLV